MRVVPRLVLFIVVFGAAASAGAADAPSALRDAHQLFQKYCVTCHGPNRQKGGVRLDTIGDDFSHVADADLWTDVMDQLNGGKMPPKGKPRPDQAQTAALTSAIARSLTEVEQDKTQGRLRRLSRDEYTRTLEDLLGIMYVTPDDFPPDPPQHHFDNNPDALSISPRHLEQYLAVADEALSVAMGLNYRAPGSVPRHVFNFGEDPWRQAVGRHAWDVPGKPMTRAILVPKQSVDMARNLWHTGMQTIRATVAQIPGTHYDFPPRLVVTMNNRQLFDVAVTASVEHPQEIEYHFFDRGDNMRLFVSNGSYLPTGEANQQPHKLDAKQIAAYRATVPCLVVDHIEYDGTDLEPWPPTSRSRIFFAGEQAKPTPDYARQIIARFMARAFRRPVQDDEIDHVFALVSRELDKGEKFEIAIKFGLRAVLCSPKFLFLLEGPAAESPRATGRELAARLSYFLWSSMPDEELASLADSGALLKADVLAAQVDRMLADPHAGAFVDKFCDGWLELDRVGLFTPDRYLYPDYEPTLQKAMVGETRAFFRFILNDNLDIRNFIQSDWAALNERMARHYGIKGVSGDEFRKVQLPDGSGRGGLLTQTSILTLTGDGLRTKPVARGKWILENLLGTPPPPPPPNAGQLPNIPEFTRLSIREQLDRHRTIESCAACHAKIDPFGFALENYDAVGLWRDHYLLPDPKLPKHQITGFEPDSQLISWAHEGRVAPIDPSATLPDGARLASLADLQNYLILHEDQFCHGLTEKLFIYAMGRRVRFSDRPAIDRLAAKLKLQRTLRGLIKDLVTSEPFLSRS